MMLMMRHTMLVALLGALAFLSTMVAAADPSPPRAHEAEPVSEAETETASEAEAFFSPYGLASFSRHAIDALDAYLTAQAAYDAGDPASAKVILDELWAAYPVGGAAWGRLPGKPFGINLGTPPCYYALRMLTDLVEWRLANPQQQHEKNNGPPPRRAILTVLVVGQTSGIQPRNHAELEAGTGEPVLNTVDPRLQRDAFAAIHESLALFREYVLVVTKGRLGLDVRIVELPEVSLPVIARAEPMRYAGLVDAAQVFDFVSAEIIESTDWWWVLYPSHVPEQHPDFTTTEFVTGGMGLGPRASPFFIIDDRWLTRKPPHLGAGEYSSIERRLYLPQWLQHEFYHHVYRVWPEFGLEAEDHQWFDRRTWPADFVGAFEPDYYHESLFKRVHGAQRQPHVALRYATTGAPFAQVSSAEVVGSYYRMPIMNGWHMGEIEPTATGYRWRNAAGVTWALTGDVATGALLTGPDNPYQGNAAASMFAFALDREPEFGDITAGVRGFTFLNEFYLSARARADLNGSGAVNVVDVAAFARLFLAGDARADFAPPVQQVDSADVVKFLRIVVGEGAVAGRPVSDANRER